MLKKENGNRKRKLHGSKALALFMSLALLISAMAVPQQAYAASMAKKSKAKYKVTVHNINSNTVLKKGTSIRISYTATKTQGKKTTGAKVKFKSSKKKVASVSKKGVIKAKKKGTTYITVYCKAKPSKKKKIKIRVGNPVSSISISGTRYLRVGRSNTLKAHVNSGATNKNVAWWSDNTAVATVNSEGKVKGKGSGICTIYAAALDGSGVYGTRTVYVHQYSAGETKWIAHRGLHTSAKENTAAAFRAAGTSGGFWGCECDIWESRLVAQSMPALPGLPEAVPDEPDQAVSGDQNTDDTNPDNNGEDGQNPDQGQDVGQNGNDDQQDAPLPDGVNDLKDKVASWPDVNSLDILDSKQAVKDAWTDYNNIIGSLSEDKVKQIHLALLEDPENRTGTDYLKKLFDAYKRVCEYESIELPINHDETFASVWGNGNYVRNLTAGEIRSQLPGVCFLDEYLQICRDYNMVPVIEFKDPYMSAEAIHRALEKTDQYGMLGKALYISFYVDVLSQVNTQATAMLQKKGSSTKPVTYYLISSDGANRVNKAKSYGFTGVSLSKSIIDSSLYNQAKANGLKVGTWTYKDKLADDEYLYKHMFANGWALEFVTVDYRIF